MADNVNVEYLLDRHADAAASTVSSISSGASTWLTDALSTASASVVSASSAASAHASHATEVTKGAAYHAARAAARQGGSGASWADAKSAILGFAAASLGSVYNLILLSYLVFIVYLVLRIIRVSILRLPSAAILVQRPTSSDPLDHRATQQERLAFAMALREWHRIETVVRQKPFQVCTFVTLSVVSLATTWYHMFAFLRWSYDEFMHGLALSAQPIPGPLTSCNLMDTTVSFASGLACVFTNGTYVAQRIHLWLRATSLFSQAWLRVVSDPMGWWWSAEICLFTTGVWAYFLRQRGARKDVPQVWMLMLLGQVCAISFAQNLFHLALLFAPSPTTELDAADAAGAAAVDNEGTKGDVELIEDALRALTNPAGISTHDESVDVEETYDSGAGDNQARAMVTTRKTTLIRTIRTRPSVLQARENFVALVFLFLALASIWKRPTTMTRILGMHLVPFATTLPSLFGGALYDSVRAAIPWRPIVRFSTAEKKKMNNQRRASVEAAEVRAQRKRDTTMAKQYGSAKIYQRVFFFSLLMRFKTTLHAFLTLNDALRNLPDANAAKAAEGRYPSMAFFLRTLYPVTFYSHPAQSSISFDNVCVGLSTTAWIITDLIHTHATRSASAHVGGAGGGGTPLDLVFESLTVAVLTFVLGPSATLAGYLWLSEKAHDARLRNAEDRLLDVQPAASGQSSEQEQDVSPSAVASAVAPAGPGGKKRGSPRRSAGEAGATGAIAARPEPVEPRYLIIREVHEETLVSG